MQRDQDNLPQVGRSARLLGVRVGPDGDIDPDPSGNVHSGSNGMSVAPSLETLPVHRVPKRLRHRRAGATGNDSDSVWAHGEGSFVAAVVAAPHLTLVPDTNTHGVVAPASSMPIATYEEALAGTKGGWSINE